MLPAGRASLNEVWQERHISSRRRIRSAIGGCVENSRPRGPIRSPWIRDGWLSHRWAVALLAERMGMLPAAALKKIAAASSIPMRSANNATAHLWLNQPSRIQGERMGPLERLFSTHPPIEDRIRRLEEM